MKEIELQGSVCGLRIGIRFFMDLFLDACDLKRPDLTDPDQDPQHCFLPVIQNVIERKLFSNIRKRGRRKRRRRRKRRKRRRRKRRTRRRRKRRSRRKRRRRMRRRRSRRKT